MYFVELIQFQSNQFIQVYFAAVIALLHNMRNKIRRN